MTRKLPFLLLIALIAGSLALFAASVPVANAASHASISTIKWFDAEGNITKVWTGSEAQANVIRRTEDAKRIAFLQHKHLISSTTPLPGLKPVATTIHPNVNRVNDCLWPNGFLVFWNNGPLVCFANNGSENTAIYNVYRMDSGGNSGGFTPTCGLYGGYETFHSHETDYPPPDDPWTVWYINITGR